MFTDMLSTKENKSSRQFRELRKEKHFTDVTLVCNDDQMISKIEELGAVNYELSDEIFKANDQIKYGFKKYPVLNNASNNENVCGSGVLKLSLEEIDENARCVERRKHKNTLFKIQEDRRRNSKKVSDAKKMKRKAKEKVFAEVLDELKKAIREKKETLNKSTHILSKLRKENLPPTQKKSFGIQLAPVLESTEIPSTPQQHDEDNLDFGGKENVIKCTLCGRPRGNLSSKNFYNHVRKCQKKNK